MIGAKPTQSSSQRAEQKKVVFGFLNHDRFDLLRRTVQSVSEYSTTNDFVLHDNGSDAVELNRFLCDFGHMFRLVVKSPTNIGIGGGINSLHNQARQLGAHYYLHLENDWLCVDHSRDWLSLAKEILDQIPKVGIVKLRKEGDGQYEMLAHNVARGVAEQYSPWWVPESSVRFAIQKIRSQTFYYGFVKKGYTNNPHLIRMKMIEGWEFDSSVHGYGLEEEKVEERPAIEGWMTACFERGIFKHIG